MMKPILPVPKRATNGFSIDSIIRKDVKERPRTCDDIDNDILSHNLSQSAAIAGRIPPLHPALPPHVRSLLLGDHPQTSHADLLNLQRSAQWTLQNSPNLPLVNSMGNGFAQTPAAPLQALHPGLWAAAAQRDPAQLFPWLMSGNYANLLRFPFGHPDPSFFFHPYRKPKRIRTAFSPSQLLKLEHAFEKNHYVVGQERKDLAAKLGLTETQVKVWFQNRRTKFKRVKSEGGSDTENGEGTSSHNGGDYSGNYHHDNGSESDSEEEELQV